MTTPASGSTRLDGRVALVTGAGRGVGRECALALARLGADVAVTGRTLAPGDSPVRGSLEEVVDELHEIGVRALAVRCDLTHEDEVERLCARVLDHFGGIDILVHNAAFSEGDQHYAPFEDLRLEDTWRMQVEVALFAPVHITKVLLPHMKARSGGTIVFLTSPLAYQDMSLRGHNIAYPAAKAAALRFAQMLALETAGTGVTTVILDPGPTLTERIEWELAERGLTTDRSIFRSPAMPAAAVAYLCSLEDASAYNGAIVDADRFTRRHQLVVDAADADAKSTGFEALRSRDFTIFVSAALISNSGNWMQATTLPYVLDQLTHSTAVVGLGAFVLLFPAVLIGPVSGSISDRYSRRTVLIWSQAGMMAAAVALWVLWASGAATAVSILAIVACSAVANGITATAWHAFVPQLVPAESMLSAARLNAVQFTVARAVGPALAGLVLAVWGPGTAFFLNAASFVVVLGALFAIAARPVGDTGVIGTVRGHFVEGVRYAFRSRALRLGLLTLVVFSFFGQSVIQLAEPFTRDVLGVGAGAFGLLVGAFGAGAIFGSLLTVLTHRRRRSQLVGLGIGVVAATEITFGAAPGYALALLAVFVMGVALLASQVSIMTSIQANVDERHRGRVMSIYVMAILTGIPIGALFGGILAEFVGLRVTVIGFGVALAAVAVIGMWRADGFRPLDSVVELHVVEASSGDTAEADRPT